MQHLDTRGSSLDREVPTEAMDMDRVLPKIDAFHRHAVATAEAIDTTDCATIVPDPPQTPLFYVRLPIAPSALERAHAWLTQRTGIQLLNRVESDPDPQRCSFEIGVGVNALEFSPEEVAGLLAGVFDLARASHDYWEAS